LQEAYGKHRAVFRNYYYRPLLQTSEYIPVGAPFTSYIINNSSSPLYNAKFVPSSRRGRYCHFKGRLQYLDTSKSSSLPHPERLELFKLFSNGLISTCTLQEYEAFPLGQPVDTAAVYSSNMQELADTAIALCPGGNNPETFRLHEALAMGAIPVLVRTELIDKDFLQGKLLIYYLLFSQCIAWSASFFYNLLYFIR
jgi:hypothetical protein